MKQDDFKQLEDILTTLDVTLLNRHSYIQNEFDSVPTSDLETKKKD